MIAGLSRRLLLGAILPFLFAASACAAPAAIRLGVLQAAPEHAGELKAAGATLSVLGVSWSRFEPVAGAPDQTYIRQLRADLDTFHRAGMDVVLDLGMQYPPAWLFALPDSRYQNQHGVAFADHEPGMNVANSVFNAAVRARQASYLAALFRELGTDFAAVRLGGGWFGELNYPPATFADRSNCYWAFDALAQGTRPGLPAGLKPCPVPGWKPGDPSADHASARLFAEWYLASLQNYHDWQIAIARRFYSGPLHMLYPSWGIRPGQLGAAIAADLAGTTPPEKNGEIQRGFDFARFIDGIRDPQVGVHCTWLDSNPAWSDETSPDPARWSPAHFLASLARQHTPPLIVSAENTGGGDLATLRLCAQRATAHDIGTVFWAFARDLFDGKPPELKDLRPAFSPTTNIDRWDNLTENTRWESEADARFIRLKSTKPDTMLMLHRAIEIPAGTRAFQLTWRWRITNLKVGKLPWNDARIILDFVDAAGQKVLPQPEPVYSSSNTEGWEQKSTRFYVPAGAASLKLMPALFNVEQGVMDLGDLVLTPTDTAALDAAAKLRADEIRARTVPPESPKKASWPAELRVQGNGLVDPAGHAVLLTGVNVQGLESYPENVWTLKSLLVGIDDWKAKVIRFPVNDEFWFGRSGFQTDGGAAYRATIDQAVMLAANRGAYLVIDLHHYRAPRAAHVEFWKDAAARYQNHPAVLFDLFNEPHDISWTIWRDGGFVGEKNGPDESAFLSDEEKKKNQGFDSVGMQALVNAVRSTGAKNIVIAGGADWSGDLSGITEGYALEDKSGNGIMYSWHQYNWHKGWARRVLAAAAKHPIFVGEFGADVKKMNFIPLADQEDPYTWVPDMLGFLQEHRLNWTGWCLHPYATPVMISDWNYTPTPFWGRFAKDALSGKRFPPPTRLR